MNGVKVGDVRVGRKVWLHGRCPMYVTGIFTTLKHVLDGDIDNGYNTMLYLDFPGNEGDVFEVGPNEVTLKEIKE